METLIETFVTATGLLMSFGYYPQAWRMWRLKSAEAVSPISYGILAVGTTTWTLYGFYLRNWMIVASFFFGMVGSWLVLYLIWRYRRVPGSAQG